MSRKKASGGLTGNVFLPLHPSQFHPFTDFLRSVFGVVWINRFVQTGQSRLHNVNCISDAALGNADGETFCLFPLNSNAASYRATIQSCNAAQDGGADRDRTDDLMLAKHALSQLSYGPLLGSTKLGSSS